MQASELHGSQAPHGASRPDHELLAVGAGLSGIAVGIKLKKMGLHDFTILEKADGVGGTWRDNTYPGLAVDIPTLTYSYSFEQNPDWSNLYAPGAELKAYADHCTDKYGVRPHIQFGKTVVSAAYDTTRNLWETTLEGGETLTSRYLVTGTGFLSVPKLPDVKGIDEFKGKVMHTAAWDHDYDLAGKRVGFIGTGATAIQAIPEIAPIVERLDVYQRTPIWLLPKADLPVSDRMKKALRYVPGLQWLLRFVMWVFTDLIFVAAFKNAERFNWLIEAAERKCTEHIRNQVDDPVLQAKLTPTYSFGCKRPSFSNTFYPVFNRGNAELVTEPIERVTEHSIITADGEERQIDALICATGFEVFQKKAVPTFPIYGKDGTELTDFWEENRYQAFMGASVPNYPNYFMIFGPYSIASSSFTNMIENQSRHLVRCLKAARRRGANYIEVRRESHDRDFQEMLQRRTKMIWAIGRCAGSHTYNVDRHGDFAGLRPAGVVATWWRSHTFSMRHYRFASK